MTDQSAEDLIKSGQAKTSAAEQEQMAQDAINFEKDMKAKLRENGALLGITFGPNEGIPSMITKLTEARALILRDDEDVKAEAELPKSEQELRNELRLKETRLIRVQIANLNPNKAGLPGEILAVHNDYVGTVKKFIPFNEAGEAYHVPMLLLKMLKRKKFLQIKDPPKGSRQAATTKLVPEFAITILDPLTEQELKDLARAQGAAESAED